MTIVVLIVLALLTLFIWNDRPLTAIVLAGLLALVWVLVTKIGDLKKIVFEQDNRLASIKARLIKLETRPVSVADAQASATDEAMPVANRDSDEEPQQVDEVVHTAALERKVAVVEKSIITISPVPTPVAEAEDGWAASTTASQKLVSPIPPTPAKPSFIERAIKAVWSWFTDGNTFVRVGVIILFMGMTFLIRYAIEENLLPIELRLAAVAAVAIALLYWGWRQRETRETFSIIVQGGGISLLYLTIFASFSLYHVIPSGLAFVLLALIVIFTAMLAIMQDAKSLALFAIVGGFLAPILTSSGSNNYIGLFSYYTILNLGIFAIVWFKSWRILNFLGFLFTFVISTIWGVLSYKPEYFSTTEPFLIIFFLMYVAIGVIYARNRMDFYKDYVDSSLIFGTPLLAFGLQCAMVKDYEYGVAISAFSLAIFYIALANVLWKKYGERLRLLSESCLSLGVIFATLSIPFAIDGILTGAAWAIEGAGIVWISVKQEQKYRRLFGVVLIFAASLILVSELIFPLSEPRMLFNYAFVNSAFIGCIIIALAACTGSWLLSRDYNGKLELEKPLSIMLLAYGIVSIFAGFEYQIKEFSLYSVHGTQLEILTGIFTFCFIVAGKRLKWKMARWVSVLSVVPMAIAAILCYAYQPQLSSHYGYLVWPISLMIYFYGLKQSLPTIPQKLLLQVHVAVAVIIIGLLFWDGLWQLLLGYSLLAVAFNFIGERWSWPQLKTLALGHLPVLVLCSVGAISVDGNLIDLSSISSTVKWSFPPGYVLWPFGFAVYFYLMRQNPRIGKYSTSNMHYAGAALIFALLLWLGPWSLLLGASLLSILCCVLWRRYSWQEMYHTSMALLPIMWLVTAISMLGEAGHLFYLQDYNVNLQVRSELGILLWPLAFVGLFWSYKQYDNQKQPAPALLHSLAIILPVLLLTWEVSWHIQDYVVFNSAWHLAWLPIMAMMMIMLIMKPISWPFTVHKSYQQIALPVLVLVPVIWSIMQLFSSANSSPLSWVPLFNPIGIIQAIIIMGVLLWSNEISAIYKGVLEKKEVVYGVLAFIFLWMNVELLRAVHHWEHIPWGMPAILSADISQTALSIFWALSGLFTTLYASRKHKRSLWVFGATLLGIVVVKLFAIDFSAQDTVERIVSFTGVGILLMLVGYFSPLPPRKNIKASEA
ncbi:MAG: DUF2339 domain-containing protein [Gammaproteobacteria bacterium]|nr:DUF2339 domain-containing protein [Gammaproteobacteria bacterium]